MQGGKRVFEQRRLLSFTISMMFILSPLLIGISIQLPSASAGSVGHKVGNLEVDMLTDYGRILFPLKWGSPQTVQDPTSTLAFIGLVIDHDNYDHTPGSEDIADCFDTYPYMASDDFQVVKPLEMVIDDGTLQKSVAEFENTGIGTGYPNDILINQTCWTVKNKDWAILQWTISNIKSPSTTLTNVRIGLEVPISKEGGRYGLGGNLVDSGDDVDNYDLTNDVYWAQDLGDGTTIGFGSAIVSDPITHYYAEDYYAEYENPSDPSDPDPKYYKNFFGNDSWLYERISAPSATATNGVTPGNITTTVGWDGFDILAGESRTVTLVIAINSSFSSMITAIEEARYYYHNLVTGFQITEIRDSGSASARIEVYNNGREPLVNPDSLLTLTSNSGTLTGTWSHDPIPTYKYSYLTVTGGSINAEGDTITLEENSVPIDQVSFGQDGIAPDPLVGESTGRRFDTSIGSYTDEWLRDPTPTWDSENDVGIIITSPLIVINRVLFNPFPGDPEEGYVELMYTGFAPGGINIQNYRIVCDDVYLVPSVTLTPTDRFYVFRYSDMPSFFTDPNGMTPTGDNVYLYNVNDDLLDMVGWSSPHTQGRFMSRMPDGNGTFQGYDDAISQAAGWVFDQMPKLIITEFYADSTSAQIELYNPRGGNKVLSPRWTFDVSGGALTGNWNNPTITLEGYAWFTMAGGGPPGNEGDTISLYYQGSYLRDEVSYGTSGLAPDPLKAETTARYWDSSIAGYNDDWTREDAPTFGAQNDVPPTNFSSAVLLNEILFYPNVIADGFIELYLLYGTLDISNYKIVGNTEFNIPFGTVLDSNNPFFCFTVPMDPAFFTSLSPSGDNVYLYDDNGSLLDMAGWNSLHNQGKSMRRIPDGNGTRDGYNDTSSIAAGWVFDCIPTPAPTPPPLPAPPTGLIAKLVTSAKDVMLSWNASADDGKGENDVVGYSVYKSSTGVNGSYVFEEWIQANGSLSYNWTDINAGDGDWNDYFYIVRANDTLDNEEQNENKVGKFVNYLVLDWNLFSVPLIQINTSMEYVLQTIKGNYITLQGYHAGKSRPWLHWHKPKPHYFNDVIEINHKNGYYINMLNPDYLIVAGKVPTNTQIPLKTGWNLIGYPCLINKPVNDALSSIAGKYNMVEYYDTVKDREVRLGPNDYMKPGLGYWIHAIEDCVIIM